MQCSECAVIFVSNKWCYDVILVHCKVMTLVSTGPSVLCCGERWCQCALCSAVEPWSQCVHTAVPVCCGPCVCSIGDVPVLEAVDPYSCCSVLWLQLLCKWAVVLVCTAVLCVQCVVLWCYSILWCAPECLCSMWPSVESLKSPAWIVSRKLAWIKDTRLMSGRNVWYVKVRLCHILRWYS